jgi:hypothetical protein
MYTTTKYLPRFLLNIPSIYTAKCNFFNIVNNLVNSISTKEELPEQCKKSVIVPVYKKVDNTDDTDCSNICGISLLSTSYKIVSIILPSKLSQYVDKIIADHQCEFRSNRSSNNNIFCVRQILEKKLEYNETVHQLFY